MSGYIDLHNHILPRLDDGPRSTLEAVALARALTEAGYGTVIATPHSGDGRPAPGLIKVRLAALQKELDQRGIALRLLPGAEQHIEPEILKRLQKGEIQTINDGPYLLLELPMLQPLPPYTVPLISALREAGYRPIIPHPERTLQLQGDHAFIYSLHEAGALFQVTWGALTGLLGPSARRTAEVMVECGLAHFFATDAHGPASRLLQVDGALERIRILAGPVAVAEYLATRPARVVAGLPLELPEPCRPPARPGPKPSLLTRIRQSF